MIASIWAIPAGAETCPARAEAAAREAYDKLDLAGAIAATAGVESCGDGTAAAIAEALRWRAQALAAMGDAAAAVDAFALVELLSPGYVLDPMLSPKLHGLHQAGREQAHSEKAVVLRQLRPDRRGDEVLLRVEVHELARRVESVVFDVELPGRHVTLQGARAGDGVYEAKAELRGPATVRVIGIGDGVTVTSQPLKLEATADAPVVTPLTPRSLAESPAVSEEPKRGVIVGVAVGGAVVVVVAIIAVAVIAQPRPAQGSLGRIEIP